jgi:hypothetical protein
MSSRSVAIVLLGTEVPKARWQNPTPSVRPTGDQDAVASVITTRGTSDHDGVEQVITMAWRAHLASVIRLPTNTWVS